VDKRYGQHREFLAPHVAARNAATVDGLPYRIEEVLHFFNGGGVYRGWMGAPANGSRPGRPGRTRAWRRFVPMPPPGPVVEP
jgi:hypothetical protein